jgi:hypothetical protein
MMQSLLYSLQCISPSSTCLQTQRRASTKSKFYHAERSPQRRTYFRMREREIEKRTKERERAGVRERKRGCYRDSVCSVATTAAFYTTHCITISSSSSSSSAALQNIP